ncbi:hypothetical protein V8E54_011440 [Elaphomyces granulatus]
MWIGALCREINTLPRPSDELLSRELFKPTADVLIDARDRIVGNGTGLQLLSRLDKLEEKLVAMHQQHLDDYDLSFEIRKATLDDWSATLDGWSGKVNLDDAQEREDVAVIAAFEGKPEARFWKEAFRVSYGVEFDAMKHVIKNVPDEILLMINRRASAKRLVSWQKKRTEQAKNIIDCADEAISLWAQSPETSFSTRSRGYKLLRLIEDLWNGD